MTGSLTPNARFALLAWGTTVAGALAFLPLLEGFGFVLTAALVTAVPMAVGIGLRAARLPAWIVVLGQAFALLLWVTALFADDAPLGFVPTPQAAESLRLLLDSGLQAAQVEPPPAPATPGLVLLTTLGIAACHLLVDFFAATVHRVPLTGLPLLALYTVPAAIAPEGVPTLAFVAGATGFVMMLASDERTRLSQWGRQLAHGSTGVGRRQRTLAESALSAAAQRVGVLAIAAAAIVPLLLPQFPEGLLGRGTGDGPGEGGTVRVDNPIVDIRRELRELSSERAMTVRTDGPVPEYFRLAVLDEFDGRVWEFSRRRLDAGFNLEQALAAPPGLDADVPASAQTFDVEVSPQLRSEWLPTPYAPSVVRVDGDWRYDPETLDIIAGDEDLDTSGLSYRVTALLTHPNGNHLDEATGAPSRVINRFTDVPDDLSDDVKDLTESIVGVGNRYQKAVRLQQWFREPGRFEYTLDAPQGHSDNDLARFLLEDRRGYCEQFAAAMAVMARYAGIPARVAVGFLRPTRVGEGEYEYTFAAMHAWPELYFEGAGWVEFEPTPAAREGAVAPPYSTGDLEPETNDPASSPSPTTAPTQQPTGPDRELDPGAAGGAADDAGPWGTAMKVVAGLLVAGTLLPGLLRLLLTRRRWSRATDDRRRAEVAWDEVRDTFLDLRHGWPQTTPRRAAQVVRERVAHSPEAVAALDRLALAVERARYARVPSDGATLRRDVETVCATLRRREARTDRLRARLVPRSLRTAYRRWLSSRPVRSQTRDDDASALPFAP